MTDDDDNVHLYQTVSSIFSLSPISETFRYHEASAWGISIQGNTLITGSMDGTIGVIDLEQMKLLKHFKAHDDEWGGN